jgi:hypothetical protein
VYHSENPHIKRQKTSKLCLSFGKKIKGPGWQGCYFNNWLQDCIWGERITTEEESWLKNITTFGKYPQP